MSLFAALVLMHGSAASSRLQAAADVPGTSAAVALDVRLEFRAATFGSGIGEVGLHTADLDGTGPPEMVVTASVGFDRANFWYVLARRGGGYRQVWASGQYRMGISSLAVGAVDVDASPEIAVATGNQIEIFDGQTRERQWVIDTSASEVRDLQVADVDSDGAAELTFCSPEGLHIYDAVTGTLELPGVLGDCTGIAVGNVDADAALEIVVGNRETTGYIVDGVTRVVEWEYPLGFGYIVRLGDVDGDDVPEIVAGHWDHISVLDAVDKVEENSLYPEFTAIDGLEVADVEGDGPLEVVWADDQFGDIHVIDGATLAEKWHVRNPEHGVTNVAVADTDADGARELLWGSGAYLFVVDTVTQQTEWMNPSYWGPFYGLAYGDLQNDGKHAFLFTTSGADVGLDDGLYLIYGAVNQRLRYASPGTTGSNWTGLKQVQVANVDGDPQLEVLVASGDLFQGILICYDGLTHAEQWRAPVADGLLIWSVQLGDVDGDGSGEVVVGTDAAHSGAPGMFVYVFDAATGTQEWRSPSLASFETLSLLRLAQLDGDAALEILVAEYDGRLFQFDGATHVLTQLAADGITALDVVGSNATGRAEIVVGTSSGELRIVNPGRRRPDRVIGRYGARIDGLAARDVTGDSITDYTFAVEGSVNVVDGHDRRILWQSGWIGEDAGAHDSLRLADIDDDGRLELMVNTGGVGVEIYEMAAP